MTSDPAADALAIALDRDADVPVGVQLTWALRARIAAGALRPGDRLPALHRLAADAGVNANTVRAVYARLEHDGLVTTRHGSGTFVREVTPGGPVAQLAADAAHAAQAAGVDPRELAAALYVSDPAPAPEAEAEAEADGAAAQARATGGEAAVRRRLRGQIAALEHALAQLAARPASDTGAGAGGAAGEQRAPTPRPRLLSAAELAVQRDELLQRLAEVHRAP